jgi:hypothetical protein
MSQAEMDLWATFANRRQLDVDDVVHAAALSGLTDQLARDGDEIGTHVAAVCERELLARLGLEAGTEAPRPGGGLSRASNCACT